MAREDIFKMSHKDLKRLHIIHKILDKSLTQIQASDILGLCDRQIRRIVTRVKDKGDEAIIHRMCGKPSHNATSQKIKDKVLNLCQTKYQGFGPTLASEKLLENHKIKLSDETLRGWFGQEGISYKTQKARPHRQWRERKPCFGQMLQMDGSHHDWLEGRGPILVLMAYIDDATGNVFARFYDYEGTFPAMDSFNRYIKKYGIPESVYLDKHTTYKSPREATLEEELKDLKPKSQFERALGELGVSVIHANSPQAKGRIERLFKTFQDRLVKEMRLKDIKTKKDANEYLARYLPSYNRRFQVEAKEKVDLHRSVKGMDLKRILCLKETRTLKNDFTVAYKSKLYQIKSTVPAKTLKIEERLNGGIKISHNGSILKHKEIKEHKRIPIPLAPRQYKSSKPKEHHPWKQTFRQMPIQYTKTGHSNNGENRTF
jgi:hypothetical protein